MLPDICCVVSQDLTGRRCIPSAERLNPLPGDNLIKMEDVRIE